jgi:exocyst complex component 3
LPLEGGETLRDYFNKLDDVVNWFDEHVGNACLNIIDLVQNERHGLVVRLALVIEDEEKKDKQAKALQDAQKELGSVASRFKSLNVGARSLRGYKKKFLQCVETTAQQQFMALKDGFNAEPDKIDKHTRWFFNHLNTVKLGMVDLLPKKWKIFQTYVNIYHQLMHDFLVDRLDDPNITPVHMLAVLNWVPKYYNKLTRLGASQNPETDLVPHVIDDREADLVREYRSLITKAVEEWMERMAATDRRTFKQREEGSLDQDADGYLHTKSLGDMWTMLREQLSVAQSSGRPDVVEGVVDAMLRALKARQNMWQSLLDAEFRRIDEQAAQTSNPSDIEGVGSFQDWLVAVANDQITNIDDQPDQNQVSFLTRFKADYEPLVSPSYPLTHAGEIEALTNGYIDLASHCLQLFARLLFATDFRAATKIFFTPAWYTEKTMQQITTTFDDYLASESNILDVLHTSLRDILIGEMSDELLVSYLSAVKTNKPVKFRRSDPFTDQIRNDILMVFTCFQKHSPDPDTFATVKEKWRAVNFFEGLISSDKASVPEAFERMKRQYWDVQLAWVEAVLRTRDDFERGMLSAVKNRAAGVEVERGVETVVGRVK